MAIKSLSRILPQWEKWAKTARSAFEDAEYPLPNNTPKFLGYTINDFNLTDGRPVASFAKIMDKISDCITSELIPNLASEGMLLDDALYTKASAQKLNKHRNTDKYCLGEISNFNKLIAISNKNAIPIYEIDPKTIYMEAGQKRTLNWFKALFNSMTDKILILTS
jgi:hypothetical protein